MNARSPSRSTFLGLLYTQNPFYAISAVLMLYAVRSAYGTLEIGTINCTLMMGVLGGYTVVLAVLAVLLIRRGGVWDDARSLLLLLLLLFLGVSVSADDLFANTTERDGLTLVLGGYTFSALVSEVVLRMAQIRLRLGYRIPYHALLALFYLAPWWLTPELHARPADEQSWMLLAFPTAAAALLLLLLPAARGGRAYTADNGTPWPWPWFPWTAFGIITAAIAFRSYVLSMTFGLTGPIWQYSSGGKTIVFDTIWGPYFLVPLAMAVLLLLLEASIASGNRTQSMRVLAGAPFVLALALPNPLGGAVYRDFLATVTETVGSPLWITVWLLTSFYGIATLRSVPRASLGLAGSLFVLAYAQPTSTRLGGEPIVWPLVAVAVYALVRGVRERRSDWCLASLVPLVLATSTVVSTTTLAPLRDDIALHVGWIGFVVIGLAFRDQFSKVLRPVGAIATVATAIALSTGDLFGGVPTTWRIAYALLLGVVALGIARLHAARSYGLAGATILLLVGYDFAARGFWMAVRAFGIRAVSAFTWSVGALLLAVLISAHKARWLPARLLSGVEAAPDGPPQEG